ncbi:thermonuclease family protein [Mangrovibrevibacter kandeliae]|uniref:thermonuclease family protein n=1 Tax=Mangrovibrevibacter kandeliae TaxID=2968473 RepID=UPI002119AA24|nr:thermonuclease family protein [Aurantimonas sp. CSK15Z-1]MCQ8781744.1 thermonuclease family protein [Aurantimonas sp. CSK15Z-1]
MLRTALLLLLLSAPALADPLPICEGGHRAERKLTCIVDGDTGWQQGVKWRLLGSTGGVDAPELSKPECPAEKRKAIAARDRLRELMGAGYTFIQSGNPDRYGRMLARIQFADGRDAGDVLMSEGLAQPWPNKGNVWCGR